MFNGDIAKFNPADLLLFLSHLDKEGVLTVTRHNEGLNVSFRNSSLVDAHSEQADAKILRAMNDRRLIDAAQYEHITRVKQETGLPLRQILENLGLLGLPGLDDILEAGIREVLFQLFLWEAGRFQFAEIGVDRQPGQRAYDCQTLALDTARAVDEYREILRTIPQLDQTPVVTEAGRGAGEHGASPEEQFVLSQSNGQAAVRSIAARAPFPTYEAVKAFANCLTHRWIELTQAVLEAPVTEIAESPVGDNLFFSYKRSLKKIATSGNVRPKVTELISFCKEHFERTLVVAFKDDRFVRCMGFRRLHGGRLDKTDLQHIDVGVEDDDIFKWVSDTHHAYFGVVLPSKLLSALGEQPPGAGGECAIIPLGNVDDMDFMVYAASSGETGAPGPFHYLELLAWHIHPPADDAPPAARRSPADTDDTPEQSRRQMKRMVSAMKEVPPMPSVLARTLELLSDPNSQMAEVAETLSHDQGLVARLIKVSNSALYGGSQKISTLSQAAVRLGTRTIRSLVVVASTRTLFPSDGTHVGVSGHTLWQHSVECGLAARRVAEAVGHADPEEAFVAGVLHDIGKVVTLLNLPDEYRRVVRAQSSDHVASTVAEVNVLGFDHTMVGEMLLSRWNMPEGLKACVRYHHRPHGAGHHQRLAWIVACGDYLSHSHGSQPDGALADATVDIGRLMEHLGISEDRLQALRDKVIEDFESSHVLL